MKRVHASRFGNTVFTGGNWAQNLKSTIMQKLMNFAFEEFFKI
jgi:hypothetical protein